MASCIFCDIVAGKIKGEIIYSDQEVAAFRDINPQAPVHILIVTRKHISTTNELEPADSQLIGKLVLAAKSIAQKEGISERGYRMVLNCNAEAGQSVFHIHLHLLGGRAMKWPPG